MANTFCQVRDHGEQDGRHHANALQHFVVVARHQLTRQTGLLCLYYRIFPTVSRPRNEPLQVEILHSNSSTCFQTVCHGNSHVDLKLSPLILASQPVLIPYHEKHSRSGGNKCHCL